MPGESTDAWQQVEKAMADLAALRQFSGPPAEFWPAFMAAAHQLTGADQLALLIRPAGQAWRRLVAWPPQPPASRMLGDFINQAEELASRAFAQGRLAAPLNPREGGASGNFVIGSRIALAQAEDCALIGVISEVTERA